MEKLSGKTALVTGSTDGVGRLVARKLGEAGARVLVHGRDAERGARVVADIEASGGVAAFLAADLPRMASGVNTGRAGLIEGPEVRIRLPPAASRGKLEADAWASVATRARLDLLLHGDHDPAGRKRSTRPGQDAK